MRKRMIKGLPQALYIMLGTMLVCGLSAMSPGKDAASKAALHAPAWTVDLSDYGAAHIDTKRLVNPFDGQTGLFFSESDALVGYFITRAPQPSLSGRDQGGQFKVRAVVLAGETGARQAVKDWPAEVTGATLLPVAGGGLAVKNGDRIDLYSHDFKLVSSLDVSEKEKYEDRYLKISPDGTVLWFIRDRFISGRSVSDIERFEARNLTKLSSSESDIPLGPSFTVSAEAMARDYQTGTIVIVGDGHTWHTVLKPRDAWCVGQPVFVNNAQLLVAGCNHISLIDTTGNILMDDRNEKGWHIETGAVTSRNGKCGAVSFMKTKGGAFDTAIRRSNTKIVVYDFQRKQRIYEVEVSPTPSYAYKFALSSDGSLLAVMTDTLIEVYAIPVAARAEDLRK